VWCLLRHYKDDLNALNVLQVVHGLKQKILKLEGQVREKEEQYRFVVNIVK